MSRFARTQSDEQAATQRRAIKPTLASTEAAHDTQPVSDSAQPQPRSWPGSPQQMMALQRAVGNQALQRMIQRKPAPEAEPILREAEFAGTQPAVETTDEAGGVAQMAPLVQRIAQIEPQHIQRGFWGKVWGGIKKVGGAIASGAKAVGGAIATGAKAAWGGITTAADAVWTGTKWVGKQLWSKLTGIFERIAQAGQFFWIDFGL